MISSIVIAMGYFAWFLLDTQFHRYRDRAGQEREYSLLEMAWRIDFDRSVTITDTIDHSHILFHRPAGLVRYVVNADAIIRRSPASTDSFALKAVVTDIWYVNDSLLLIRGIRLDILLNGAHIPLTDARTYSAKDIMGFQRSNYE